MRGTVLGWAVAGALLASVSMASAEADPKVEKVWKAKCASCHGPDGKGATKQGAKMKVGDMSSAAWKKDMTDEKMKEAINKGFKREKDGVQQKMEASKQPPEMVDGLVALIKDFK